MDGENKISVGTIARTVALAVTIANLVLNNIGKNPLPFSDTEVYTWVSDVAAFISIIISWWKNNSFTPAAIKADKVKDELKGGN